ncbi:hypothetical protein UFOVP555_58 [uncultured Caudovirales phage]|uniref:Uncharacterized protein n=1 Tax=uncultured Caudovirales phage TaxID=2100421 RepID=A0A6J5MS58_9CAUD|nr:hypothetical protein UFOVP555_58 [uncultured Caudovirales phage]
MSVLTEQQREELRIDFAVAAMPALLPTFRDAMEPKRNAMEPKRNAMEPKRNVIAHKSFRMAEAMLDVYERRTWEFKE